MTTTATDPQPTPDVTSDATPEQALAPQRGDTSHGAPLTVIVADDEPLARQRIRRLLHEEPGVEIVGECANGEQAVRLITERRPDVVFLDIRMPKLDGLGVVRLLPRDLASAIVFVTAFDEHATAAFDVAAVDYVMKPVEPERLRLAITRARRQRETSELHARHTRLLRFLQQEMSAASPGAGVASMGDGGVSAPERGGRVQRVLVKERDRRYFIEVQEIDWLEAAGNYVRLHVGAQVHLFRGTMVQMEQSLDPQQFARVHRSCIVNLSRVKEIQPWFSGDYVLILKNGTKLKMGRAFRSQFESRGLA